MVVYTISSKAYLDSLRKCYKNIIVINKELSIQGDAERLEELCQDTNFFSRLHQGDNMHVYRLQSTKP